MASTQSAVDAGDGSEKRVSGNVSSSAVAGKINGKAVHLDRDGRDDKVHTISLNAGHREDKSAQMMYES